MLKLIYDTVLPSTVFTNVYVTYISKTAQSDHMGIEESSAFLTFLNPNVFPHDIYTVRPSTVFPIVCFFYIRKTAKSDHTGIEESNAFPASLNINTYPHDIYTVRPSTIFSVCITYIYI